MKNIRTAVVGALALGLLGCGSDNNSDSNQVSDLVVEVSEDITNDTVWESGTYIMPTGDFRVQAKLTIEPCTIVELGNRTFINDGGYIVAIGTEECPIVFTSRNDNPAAGDNRGLIIEDSADNGNEFEHVVFEYTGQDNGAVDAEAGVKFRNTTVRHTPDIGLTLNTADILEFTDVTFEEIGGFPFNVSFDNVSVIDGVTTSAVENDKIAVVGGDLTADDTWDPESIPYQLFGDARFNAALTVEAGTILQINADDRFFIEDGGSITANGTADEPVVIESANDTKLAGDWRFIEANPGASQSTFTNTIIRHGGSGGNGALVCDVSCVFEDVTFEDNEECDVGGDPENVMATNTDFVSCN